MLTQSFRKSMAVLLCTAGFYAAESALAENPAEQLSQECRPLSLLQDGHWIGSAICYGPHREGQRPGEKQPTREQLKEDLQIISKHWPLFRTYGSTDYVAEMLEILREEKLPVKVMLGAWIGPEVSPSNDDKASLGAEDHPNRRQVDKVIELANEYEDFVIAVSVGNETQVTWSGHKVPEDLLIKYLREVRMKTNLPVTTADDFMYWSTLGSKAVANEVDFITTHMHPVWHAQEAENALAFVKEKYNLVVKMHPNSLIVIGETGWATRSNPTGRESKYVVGKMGEDEQLHACQQIVKWAEKEKIATFIFEAFDEPWKGAGHPSDVEKHWGQFNVDRSPKKVLKARHLGSKTSDKENIK